MKHVAGDISVENYHAFARRYLRQRGKLPYNSISDPDDRRRFITEAVAHARADGLEGAILDRPTDFFDEEFEWIQQHGIESTQDYVAESPRRTASRVPQGQRPLLFNVYERYLAQRRLGGKRYDWSDLASTVLAELRTDQGGRHHRHVVIDEGQDFSPEMLRSLAATIPDDGSLTFFGDIAQQIYGHRVSWRSAGLKSPKVWRFSENYRNSKQISRLALALADAPYFPDDPDLVPPTAPVADGPLPILRHATDEGREWTFVIENASRLAQTGLVAVLFKTRDEERRHRVVNGTRLHRDLPQWPSGPGLFYGTYHAAKGLEFDAVFLPFLSQERWPDPADVRLLGYDEAAVRSARLLYVGVTRARSTLVLTYSGEATPLLPRSKDVALYQ